MYSKSVITPNDPEYAEIMRSQMLSSLKKAGIHKMYLNADCSLGHDVYDLYKQGKGTYLYGPPGTGKTYAASCAIRLAVENEQTACLTSVKSLLDAVKAEYDENQHSVLQRAVGYDILALDDLGMERPTEWAMETIEGIVDARVSDCKPIIVTSNYSLKELRERWGGIHGARLVSRLGGSCMPIKVGGPDRRLNYIRSTTRR